MYIKTMENRKVLVKRLERLTGTKAVYTRMPECAFVVGDFKVERYGTLVIGDEADGEVIEALLSEGMIKEYAPEPEPEPEKEPEPSKVEVSFPMEVHTARSLRNLAAMLYSRGRLISKSTGGEFSCSADQMEKLKEADSCEARSWRSGDAKTGSTPSGRSTQTRKCRSGSCWSWWTRWSRTACRSGWRGRQKL